jgi:anti-sigma B factor antagonist
VTDKTTIFYGKFENYSLIRVVGKGSFLISSHVKECAEESLKFGENRIVIDLECCSGMDSTFMGMLAGLAIKLENKEGGRRLEIAASGDKNRASLEDLGLDALLDIDLSESIWRTEINSQRLTLSVWESGQSKTGKSCAVHVLESHKILSTSCDANAQKFEGVIQTLEKELQ